MFQTDLQGVQLAEVREKLAQIGDITDEEALKLVVEDEEMFKKYLYYTSAKNTSSGSKNQRIRN